MPAVEIADSIVQSGRETLENAIALVRETKRWGAEVCYICVRFFFFSD